MTLAQQTQDGPLNDHGVVNLDETISIYFYSVLSAQVDARISLPESSVVAIIGEKFVSAIKSRVKLSDMITKYQSVLSNASSPPNFVMSPHSYVVPTYAGLAIKRVMGCNEMLTKAPGGTKVESVLSAGDVKVDCDGVQKRSLDIFINDVKKVTNKVKDVVDEKIVKKVNTIVPAVSKDVKKVREIGTDVDILGVVVVGGLILYMYDSENR